MSFMFLGFGGFFQSVLLVINAIAILSEDRFLARIGWSMSSPSEPAFGVAGGGSDQSVKGKIVQVISSVRTVARIPLIGANALVILYTLVLG